MKQVIIQVEDSKLDAFVSLIQSLDYVSITEMTTDIPEWQKEEVKRREELVDAGKMKLYSWKEVEEQLLVKK